MSNNYFEMITADGRKITLTAYVGPARDRRRVQLSITPRQGGDEFDLLGAIAQMNQEQMLRLAGALTERALGGISATGEEKSMYTDGVVKKNV